MVRIALFSSRTTYEETIRMLMPELKKYADIRLYIFEELQTLPDVYAEVKNQYEGFLFSGWLLYALVSAKYRIEKPHEYFFASEADFYRTILKSCAENPGTPFSHMLIDKPEKELGYEDIMTKDNHCIYPDITSFADTVMPMADTKAFQQYFYTVKNAYIKAYEENPVEIIITGFPGLSDYFASCDVKFYHLHAGKSTIISGIRRLVNSINSGNYSQMLSVYGIVKTAEGYLDLVESKISSFIWRNGLYCMLYRRDDTIRMVITYQDFNRITKDISDCLISHELLDQNIKEFSIGWGVGYTITLAHDNAKKAIKIARHSNGGASFVVTESDSLIGPLLSEKSLSVNANDDNLSIHMSNCYDISRLNVKRIQAIIEKTHNNVFTSSSLSMELGISQRNARRILSKLLQHGGAELIDIDTTPSKGRPELVYKIQMR